MDRCQVVGSCLYFYISFCSCCFFLVSYRDHVFLGLGFSGSCVFIVYSLSPCVPAAHVNIPQSASGPLPFMYIKSCILYKLEKKDPCHNTATWNEILDIAIVIMC